MKWYSQFSGHFSNKIQNFPKNISTTYEKINIFFFLNRKTTQWTLVVVLNPHSSYRLVFQQRDIKQIPNKKRRVQLVFSPHNKKDIIFSPVCIWEGKTSVIVNGKANRKRKKTNTFIYTLCLAMIEAIVHKDEKKKCINFPKHCGLVLQ